MGKSPAKWFKTVLLGKKGPKPKIAKGNEKAANEGEVLVVGKTTERNLAAATIASHLSDADSVQENLEMDNKEDESSPKNADMSEIELEVPGPLVALNSPARRELDQSATKVQASFRGYLARRTYLALKGIIKLQALVRGHLVRRQAVSTVHCMLGIVKLQAHVRGKMIGLSDIGLQVQGKVVFHTIWERKLVNAGDGKYILANNLSANVFSRKFLVSSPKPLHLQYDSTNPNSVTSWLDRWSASKFWKQVPVKPDGLTGQDPNQSTQSVQTETSRTKRNNKLPSARVDNGSTHSSFDVQRSRRTFRKPSIHSVEISDPEAAKSELEKVKRSLRKVHESAFPPAAEDDKPKKSSDNIIATSVEKVPEQTNGVAPEKITEDPCDTLPTLVDVEASAEQQKGTVTSDSKLVLQTSIDTNSSDKITEDDKKLTENEESSVKQDMLDNENQKVTVKESFQAKNESPQNVSNKQPKVPSYMLATKSAKAKLRDSSALLENEAPEKIPSTRRHSLPSATGTKVTSSSPKTQKLTTSTGKTKNKREKPLTASKDGSGKADWRR